MVLGPAQRPSDYTPTASVVASASAQGGNTRRAYLTGLDRAMLGFLLLLMACNVGAALLAAGWVTALATELLGAAYLLVAFNYSYSDGSRAGYIQKFSHKGWICKTYEGELSLSYTPGMAPVLWTFSVRDESVARKINDALGKKVVLHYNEHRGIPTDCFGDTQYFVDGVRILSE